MLSIILYYKLSILTAIQYNTVLDNAVLYFSILNYTTFV